MTTGDAWFIGYVSGQATAVGIGVSAWLMFSQRGRDRRRRRHFARFMRETEPAAAEDKAVYGVAKCYGPDGERRPQDDVTTLTWPWSRTKGRC